jgi:hypothetical protein
MTAAELTDLLNAMPKDRSYLVTTIDDTPEGMYYWVDASWDEHR